MSPTDVQEYKKFEDELIAFGMTLNALLERGSAPMSCEGCKWLGKRHQKCSCCRRNNGMKDNYEEKTP